MKRRTAGKRLGLATLFLLAAGYSASAQGSSVSSALKSVKTEVASVFTAAADIMYAVAALAGLIGAVLLYQKWNSGDPNTGKLVGAWIGFAVFIALAATFLKAVFKV
jgi:hypothetical protein